MKKYRKSFQHCNKINTFWIVVLAGFSMMIISCTKQKNVEQKNVESTSPARPELSLDDTDVEKTEDAVVDTAKDTAALQDEADSATEPDSTISGLKAGAEEVLDKSGKKIEEEAADEGPDNE